MTREKMTRKIKHASTSFGNIAYEEQGEGPPALFVHGVFRNGYLWRHVIEGVSDLRRCIAVDLMAHGGTETRADQDVDFTAQAGMLAAFCDGLKLDQVDLVANDSGAGIAQIFAAHHPARIRSLCLTNSDTHDNWPPPAFQPTVELARRGELGARGRQMLADIDFARTVFARAYQDPTSVSPETNRIYLEPIYGSDAAVRNLERFVAGQDCRHTVAIEPLLRRLTAPTLLVWGTDDIFFPVKWAYWLRDTIPGCKTVIEVEGGRLLFIEEQPEMLIGPLREHWQAASAAPAVRVA
jgi:pimeloyl-ACP methyl ester carboxylesterase